MPPDPPTTAREEARGLVNRFFGHRPESTALAEEIAKLLARKDEEIGRFKDEKATLALECARQITDLDMLLAERDVLQGQVEELRGKVIDDVLAILREEYATLYATGKYPLSSTSSAFDIAGRTITQLEARIRELKS